MKTPTVLRNTRGSLTIQVLIFCASLVVIGSSAAILAAQQDKATLKIKRRFELDELKKLMRMSLDNYSICNALVNGKSALVDTPISSISRDGISVLIEQNSKISFSRLGLEIGTIRLRPVTYPGIDMSTGAHFGKAYVIVDIKVPAGERQIKGVSSSLYFRSVDGVIEECASRRWVTYTDTTDGFAKGCSDPEDLLVDARGYCECDGTQYKPVIHFRTIAELAGLGLTTFGGGGDGIPAQAAIYCPSNCTGAGSKKVVLNVACKGKEDFL